MSEIKEKKEYNKPETEYIEFNYSDVVLSSDDPFDPAKGKIEDGDDEDLN